MSVEVGTKLPDETSAFSRTPGAPSSHETRNPLILPFARETGNPSAPFPLPERLEQMLPMLPAEFATRVDSAITTAGMLDANRLQRRAEFTGPALFGELRPAPEKVTSTPERISVMLDVSPARAGLFREDFLKKFIAELHNRNISSLSLFGYQGEGNESELTDEEMQQVVSYGQKIGVEVYPGTSLFSHVEGVKENPRFQDMFIPGTESLNPYTDEFKQFVEDQMIRYRKRYATSPDKKLRLNAGFDEAFGVDPETILTAMQVTYDIAQKYNIELEAWWADTETDESLTSFTEEQLQRIPSLEFTYWNYTVQDPDLLEERVRFYKEKGINITKLAASDRSHRTSSPEMGPAVGNIYSHKIAADRLGIQEVQVTIWADDGMPSLVKSSLALLDIASETHLVPQDQWDMMASIAEATVFSWHQENPDKAIIGANPDWILLREPLEAPAWTTAFQVDVNKVIAKRQELERMRDRIHPDLALYLEQQIALLGVIEVKASLGIDIRDAYSRGDRRELHNSLERIEEAAERVAQLWIIDSLAHGEERTRQGFRLLDKQYEYIMDDLLTTHADLVAHLETGEPVPNLVLDLSAISEDTRFPASSNTFGEQIKRVDSLKTSEQVVLVEKSA